MPLSFTAAVVSHRSDAVAEKQPSVVNSESSNASRFVHGGGGGGLGTSAGRGPRFSVRATVIGCGFVALSVIRTLTSWGPSVVNSIVGVREVLSSNCPSSSRSQA